MNARLLVFVVVVIASIAAAVVVPAMRRTAVDHGRFEERLHPIPPRGAPRLEHDLTLARTAGVGSIEQLREVEIEPK